jgi:hypothetical protein
MMHDRPDNDVYFVLLMTGVASAMLPYFKKREWTRR